MRAFLSAVQWHQHLGTNETHAGTSSQDEVEKAREITKPSKLFPRMETLDQDCDTLVAPEWQKIFETKALEVLRQLAAP
jgi:hypothetical protein